MVRKRRKAVMDYQEPVRDEIPIGEAEAAVSRIEVPEEPVPEPAPTPPAPSAPKIALRVFMQIHGAKKDQLAGFESHASRQNMGPMSVKNWRNEHSKFMAKPVM